MRSHEAALEEGLQQRRTAVEDERLPDRNTPCYDHGMANIRFTVSTAPDVQAAIRTHAEAAGMDVSAYMIAAAVAQMARDDAATTAFAALDAHNQAALAEAADIPEAELPSFAALTAADQELVRRVLGSALGSDDAGVA
jgi:uncharacterized protein (DUF1778 family)